MTFWVAFNCLLLKTHDNFDWWCNSMLRENKTVFIANSLQIYEFFRTNQSAAWKCAFVLFSPHTVLDLYLEIAMIRSNWIFTLKGRNYNWMVFHPFNLFFDPLKEISTGGDSILLKVFFWHKNSDLSLKKKRVRP